MQVLVTGAAGYIGSICSELLVSSGVKVVAVDNLSEGSRSAVPLQASFYEIDFGDSARLDEIFRGDRIDAVMHFAGEALVEKSMKDPSAFYVTNIARGIVLLDAMLRHGVRNFIFSSTCAVYGEPAVVPLLEDHFTSPVNPYGKSKLIFENILADYRRYAGLNYVSLRYFNVAGASRDRGECRRHETAILVASGEKMKRELGWQPSRSLLPEIVKSAWIWKQSHPQGYAPPKAGTASLPSFHQRRNGSSLRSESS